MLPDQDTFRWLKGQGTEKLQTLPDGSLVAYRRSQAFVGNTKKPYWALIVLRKVEQGFERETDSWTLCGIPPEEALQV